MRPSVRSLALCLVATAGCIPNRDNPVDPSVAPAASLFVVGRQDGVRCDPPMAEVLGSQGWLPTSAASRGACIGLDARDSKDPQNHPLTFTFEIEREEGFVPLSAPDVALVQTNGLVVLSNAFIRQQPVGEITRFRVVARDESGARGAATATFIPLNGRPVAIGDPLRVVPPGGFPWSPGAVTLTLDGTRSIDPDGDPLTFRWVGPDPSALETIAPGLRRWTLPDTTGETTFIVSLIASDGNLASAPVPVPVIAGDAPVWSGVAYPAGLEFIRVDTERTEAELDLGDGSAADLSILGDRVVGTIWNFQGGASGAHIGTVRTWPGLRTLAIYPDLSPFGFGASALDGTTLWHNGWGFGDMEEIVPIAISQTGTSGTMTRGTALEFPGQGNGRGLVVPAGETVWLSKMFERRVTVVTATNPPVLLDQIELGEDRQVTSMSARPDRGQVWVVEQAKPGSSLPDPAPATAHVFDSATADEIATIPLPYARAKLIWTLDDQAWIHLSGERYALVDGDLLEQTHDLEIALLLDVPNTSNSRNELVVERATGALWAELPELIALRISRTGSLREYPVPGLWEVRDTDLRGRLLVLEEDRPGAATLAPDASGVVLRVPKIVSALGAPVTVDGSFWTLFPTASSAWLIGPDGDLMRTIERVRNDSDPDSPTRLLPYGLAASVSPDGRWLYLVESDIDTGFVFGAWRYDLSATIPFRSPATPLLTGLQGYETHLNGFWLQAGAPVPGQPELFWTALGNPVSDATDIVVVTTGGGIDVRFTLPPDEVRSSFLQYTAPRAHLAAARSLVDNVVCLATISETDNSIRVRWLDPLASEPLLAETLDAAVAGFPPSSTVNQNNPFVDYSGIGGVSISSASGGELCWVTWFDRNDRFACDAPTADPEGGVSHVIAVDRTGAVVAATTAPIEGIATGIRGLDPDHAWISTFRCGETGDSLVRIDIAPGPAPAVLGTSTTFAPARSRGFLQP